MRDKPRKLCGFAGRGPLIALAIAAGMVIGIVGPTSAQFFNFDGFQQRPQPNRGGGGFGGDNVDPNGFLSGSRRPASALLAANM